MGDIPAMHDGSASPSRRERLRAELEREARLEARRLTAAHGAAGLSLSAVARSVGVSPPALYRYFKNKNALILAMYEDLTAEFVATVATASQHEEPEDIGAQLYAATRAVLDWSVAHPAEFDVLMGATYARLAAAKPGMDNVLLRDLGGFFGALFTRLWERGGVRYPTADEIEPLLRAQLLTYGKQAGQDLPPGVTLLMITCWRQIYGLLCMAVYSHLATPFDSYVPLFNNMMDDLLALLGVSRGPHQR
ncbi:TetR/AcrR family transcriptional regulator [Kitasatospora sp. NPDC059327]|uniref:TetR/AcrR family transcriptional regulator n=1 Tax=Kitasatospora sp. NPDC059327 TaxID=3346803 RepID=UPI003690AB6E